MKEQPRNTQFQINEQNVGKQPKKEFRVMIVKMIQNLENNMEVWINRLQARIEKT